MRTMTRINWRGAVSGAAGHALARARISQSRAMVPEPQKVKDFDQ